MGIDQNEAKGRRQVDKPKYSAKHPIAAIEKRVIDSEAFADLSPSAVVVLLLLARNLEKDRNGHVFLSKAQAEQRGMAAKTLYRVLVELQTHGFIYPTTRGGHGRCGTYALTWPPLSKDTKGLHLSAFKACAWRDWKPAGRKNLGVKMSTRIGQKSPQRSILVDKNPPRLGDKFTPLEVNTNRKHGNAWIPRYLGDLSGVGLAGRQCFRLPPLGALQ